MKKKIGIASIIFVALFTINSFHIPLLIWAQEEFSTPLDTRSESSKKMTDSSESQNPVDTNESDNRSPATTTSVEESSSSDPGERTLNTSHNKEPSKSVSTDSTGISSSGSAPAKGGKEVVPLVPLNLGDWMPDSNLQQAVADALGIPLVDLTPEKILNLTSFTISVSADLDLTGLQLAGNLTALSIDADGHTVSNLDLSAFPNMDDFTGQNMTVDFLNFALAPNLVTIFLSQVQTTAIDINNLPKLSSFSGTNLLGVTNLELLNLPSLRVISLYANNTLLSLTVKNLPKLAMLRANNNLALHTLVTENLPLLEGIEVVNNNFNSLTLTDLPSLTLLNANDNGLTEVNLQNLPRFASLRVQHNRISDLQKIASTSLPATFTIDASNQTIDNLVRATVHQAQDLIDLYDQTGTRIPMQLPGVQCMDYILNSPTNITWLTGGLKQLTATYNSSQITYSAQIDQVVLGSDGDGWTLLEGLRGKIDHLISNTFTRGNLTFRVDSGAANVDDFGVVTLNENQHVTNLTTGAVYTYTHSTMNGYFSFFRTLVNGTYVNVEYTGGNKIYIRINADGSEELKRVYENTDVGLKVEIITWVTKVGEIRHKVTATNMTEKPLPNVDIMLRIDASINEKETNNLYATGGGGIYMSGAGVTLYGEPLEGTTVIFGGAYDVPYKYFFDNQIQCKSPWGLAAGTPLVENIIDAIMYYGSGSTGLMSPGESVSFAYQERLYMNSEPVPLAGNSIFVRYVGETGEVLGVSRLNESPEERSSLVIILSMVSAGTLVFLGWLLKRKTRPH